MAPRPRGIAGGGSNSLPDSSWVSEVRLYGDPLRDSSWRALIAIIVICFGATIIIGSGANAITVPRTNRRPLKWGIYEFSILMSIIYLGNYFAFVLLYARGDTVQVVYPLIFAILNSSIYLADISLLGFIYFVIVACLHHLGVKAPIKTILKISSSVIISILIVFFSAILALRIEYQVDRVIQPEKVDYDPLWVLLKLFIAYDAVFAFASLELLALGVWIISRERKQEEPTWIGTCIAAIVAMPLLVRSLVNLGINAANLTRDVTVETQIAIIYIGYIGLILAYAGVKSLAKWCSDYIEVQKYCPSFALRIIFLAPLPRAVSTSPLR